MATSDIFLGRQPILDRDQRIVAYELLFRSGNTASVTVTDDMQATASVIHHTFSEMGVQAVLGSQLGFINVSADAVIERCRALKQQGFTLALDDFVFADSQRPLLALVDIVKVDILLHGCSCRCSPCKAARPTPPRCWSWRPRAAS
jgi:EAL and modified HD-GYP domain-containing signal transduction protein